jgi:hypothetical protein
VEVGRRGSHEFELVFEPGGRDAPAPCMDERFIRLDRGDVTTDFASENQRGATAASSDVDNLLAARQPQPPPERPELVRIDRVRHALGELLGAVSLIPWIQIISVLTPA